MSSAHLAHCNNCRSNMRIFMDDKPIKCPVCSNRLSYGELDGCRSCKARVPKGTERCESCKITEDPSYPGKTPS